MRKILNLNKHQSLIVMLDCLEILENDLYSEDHVDEDSIQRFINYERFVYNEALKEMKYEVIKEM